jgi:RimJ/RimL family protein N-acetyltransferase
MPELRLLPFDRSQLSLTEPWFADADTNRWLGGPRWPQLVLDISERPLSMYRGAAETGLYNWLAWENGTPVGYIGCDTYDRWTTWDGAPGGRGVTSALEVPAANLSYVVAPALRRRGHATAMINAAVAGPELAHVALFAAGVEPANTASVRCLLKAGFTPLDPTPDWEGIVYYARRAGGHPHAGQHSPAPRLPCIDD